MTEPEPIKPGSFESAAQQMVEALNCACADLVGVASENGERLSMLIQTLNRQLNEQLAEVLERFKLFREANMVELDYNRDKVLQRFTEFERSQLELTASTAQGIRQSLKDCCRRVEEKLTQHMDERLSDTSARLELSEKRMVERSQTVLTRFEEMMAAGVMSCGQMLERGKETLSLGSQQCQGDLQAVLDGWKQTLAETVLASRQELVQNAEAIREILGTLLHDKLYEVKESAKLAEAKLKVTAEDGKLDLNSQVDRWESEAGQLAQEFKEGLLRQQERHKASRRHRFDLKGHQAEVQELLDEAKSRISDSQESFHKLVKNLEAEYLSRLEVETTRLEDLLLVPDARVTGSRLSAEEYQDKLRARLTSRGAEIVKALRNRAVEIEGEFARSALGLDERIEGVASCAREEMEKQVSQFKEDLYKSNHSFQKELQTLEEQLAQIAEAGRAAALTVMAFRSADLTFDNE